MSDDHDRRTPVTDVGPRRGHGGRRPRLLRWSRHELGAVTVAAGLVIFGWLVGIVDLDLFSPDSAADLEVDLYAAAALVAAYALIVVGRRLLYAAIGRRGTPAWSRRRLRRQRRQQQ